MADIIEKAWNEVKGEGDADYANSRPEHKAELQNRAEAVQRTGVVTRSTGEPSPMNEFEAKVKELQAEQKSGKTEESLNSLTRAELDEIAEERGLTPEDYKNKTELIKALEGDK